MLQTYRREWTTSQLESIVVGTQYEVSELLHVGSVEQVTRHYIGGWGSWSINVVILATRHLQQHH